ncbi:hypothetical protein MTBUT4_180089 [Magnetospirillum sp. UT-4]|nr:hypothetical protein MTBUT4_180089 [Magnetospirillum sp. UT-4]
MCWGHLTQRSALFTPPLIPALPLPARSRRPHPFGAPRAGFIQDALTGSNRRMTSGLRCHCTYLLGLLLCPGADPLDGWPGGQSGEAFAHQGGVPVNRAGAEGPSEFI